MLLDDTGHEAGPTRRVIGDRRWRNVPAAAVAAIDQPRRLPLEQRLADRPSRSPGVGDRGNDRLPAHHRTVIIFTVKDCGHVLLDQPGRGQQRAVQRRAGEIPLRDPGRIVAERRTHPLRPDLEMVDQPAEVVAHIALLGPAIVALLPAAQAGAVEEEQRGVALDVGRIGRHSRMRKARVVRYPVETRGVQRIGAGSYCGRRCTIPAAPDRRTPS